MKLLNELKQLLKKDEKLVSDEELLKNKIVELALKLDEDLIKLLKSNKKIKEHFFKKVDDVLIFDKEKFMKFVDNKEFLPDSYTVFKNKIGLTADKEYLSKNKEVVLSWPYKDCVLEGGQEKEDEKRKEIFHNEILAPDEIDRLLDPKVFTNFKRIDAKGEHEIKEVKSDDNLIIKGNNLLALHSLKKKYAGKVKLIYIDPPYNMGEDNFKYNDNFNHSTWLTFMKNRLEVARELLKEEGSIWISIDDYELYYLKVLCDEIFGEDNFICNIVWEKKTARNNRKSFSINQDYILVFAKKKEAFKEKVNRLPLNDNAKSRYKNPDDDPRGLWQSVAMTCQAGHGTKSQFYEIETPTGKKHNPPKGLCWIYTKKKFKEEVSKDNIYFPKGGDGVPRRKFFLKDNEGLVPETIWKSKEVGTNDTAKKELLNLFKKGEVFETPKPENLIKRILEIGTNEKELILDFFLGSGTTSAVAHKMKRKYIGIEQLSFGNNNYLKRLKKVIKGDSIGISNDLNWEGGGNFIYCELKTLNEKFSSQVEKAKDSKELLKIWEEMKKNAFLSYRVDEKLFDENIDEFKKLDLEEQRKLLLECLDHNNLYVNYSEIDDKQYKISKEDKELNKKFYGGL